METYIALLRGINVSGSKKIKMVELKALFEELKFKKVKTYIQSGNVIFQSKKDRDKIIKTIFNGIKKKYGYEVTIVLKTPAELKKVIASNPYAKKAADDYKKLYITFLEEAPSKENFSTIKDFKSNNDEFVLKGTVIFVFCPDGYGTTKLHNNFFEKKLKIGATSRNWNSLNKIYNLANELV